VFEDIVYKKNVDRTTPKTVSSFYMFNGIINDEYGKGKITVAVPIENENLEIFQHCL
jgi:hypothetical protein